MMDWNLSTQTSMSTWVEKGFVQIRPEIDLIYQQFLKKEKSQVVESMTFQTKGTT